MEHGRERRHAECARSGHLAHDVNLDCAHLSESDLNVGFGVGHSGIFFRECALDVLVGLGYGLPVKVDRANLRNHDAAFGRYCLA